jgi:flagellar basal-body rod protein FlgB
VSFLDSTQLTLEAAMRGAMQRQALLNNNLANVDTPGYKREDLDFQGTLQSALANGGSPDAVTFQPIVEPQSVGANGNGVNAEQESAQIAENALMYQELTQIAGARESILKAAIGTI